MKSPVSWTIEGTAMGLARDGDRTGIDELAERVQRDGKQGGDRPRIEDDLDGRSGDARRLLTELVRVEHELRPGAGESPSPEEYVQQFPDDHAAFGIAERA
jgi:hypothetical protein